MANRFIYLSMDKVDDFPWNDDPTIFYVFFKLLFKASYKDNQWHDIEIKRGQLVTSYSILSGELNLSVKLLRGAIEKLLKCGLIGKRSGSRFSIITICDYDSWVNGGQAEGKQPGSPRASEGQAKGNNYNKDNKDNNIKEEDTYVSKKKEPVLELEKQFESFRLKYKSYGGKVRGFQIELDELKKKHKDWKEVIPMLSYAIDKEEEERSAALRRGEFFAQIKNLKTYLNQRSWECYTDGFESYNPNEYHPQDMEYDADFNAYRFYGLQPDGYVYDGYDDDNRPDGARVVSQCFVWEWRKVAKIWEQVK